MSQAHSTETVRIEVRWRSLLKVIAAAGVVWVWLQLHGLLLVLIVATMLAVALSPIVRRVQRIGVPRSAAAFIVCGALIAVIGFLVWATWAAIADQFTYLTEHLADATARFVQRLPAPIRAAADGGNGSGLAGRVAQFGGRVLGSTAHALIVAALGFIVTVYLLVEGRETRAWMLAFVPQREMSRVDQTLNECERVIYGYIVGNLITSTCATVFIAVALWLLDVPAALFLGLLTGVFDAIPVIGSIIPVIPALLLGLTISTRTALMVVAAHAVYNFLENYVIGPWAYGGRLKLSNLAVIVAVAIGGEIAGVAGALVALPIAAIYPSLERIWLRGAVSTDTIRRHARLNT